MEIVEMNFTPKNAVYACKLCNFECCKNSDWNRHINTIKHTHRVNGNKMEKMEMEKNADNICNCGKTYLTKSGLWKHLKICKQETKQEKGYNDKDLIIMLIKQNSELIKENTDFKSMMMKVIENGTANNSYNNTTNSNNKSFNLQFFLNETCKDAMNITDFVNSIELQLSDLERVGELGYVEGISNIIVKNLKELDITQRPVHCTDKKRETMYIKDEDKWEKDENNHKIKKAIKRVASKNQRLLPKFKEAHPDCGTYHSKYSDQYNKIIIESVGGSGDNDAEKEEKIIRNISKNVVVEK
jgi:hypothetical protein